MNAQTKLRDSRKAYRISLRDKLRRVNTPSVGEIPGSTVDQWVHGGGLSQGLISLTELKIECLPAYRAVFKERMTEAQERLERRLQTCAESE